MVVGIQTMAAMSVISDKHSSLLLPLNYPSNLTPLLQNPKNRQENDTGYDEIQKRNKNEGPCLRDMNYTTINARNPIKPRIPPFFASTDMAPFEVCEGLAAPTLVVGGVWVTVAAGIVFATGLKSLNENKTRKTPTGNVRSS